MAHQHSRTATDHNEEARHHGRMSPGGTKGTGMGNDMNRPGSGGGMSGGRIGGGMGVGGGSRSSGQSSQDDDDELGRGDRGNDHLDNDESDR